MEKNILAVNVANGVTIAIMGGAGFVLASLILKAWRAKQQQQAS